ncbi:LOW QUALITY PROTEIN: nmrA-like family domain-containing protein 1 [Dromaius novaehollandiae]|uniref:LOW QUALITY PROTEIN: nmrA-like family domain-containing protein 1 n=1 Tax=Dromaius novaehollandiae TaxID=8790 RepID=UPI00311E6A61
MASLLLVCWDGRTTGAVLPVGDTPMDGMAAEDLGLVVLGLLKSPEVYLGQVIGLSTSKLTMRVLGAKNHLVGVALLRQLLLLVCAGAPGEHHAWYLRSMRNGFPGARNLANVFCCYALKPAHSMELTLKLNPRACTFHQWLADNKAVF